ncbi:MAG TPA: FGGY-family carbohydrate kinase [Rugosimonospora sp.]
MSDLLLGLDIGTSSTKGVLARTDGTVLATAVREHTVSSPHAGWAEHGARTWWDEFVGIVAELRSGTDATVAAVGLSGIGPCLLPCDARGAPLRPAILYGIDTRAVVEIAEQTGRYGEQVILERCGSVLTSQAIGPKLAWLRRHEPHVWARTERLFMAHTWLVHQLTGRYVLDHHSASQCTPLYDSRVHDWIPQWAGDIASGLALPELRWPGEIAGTVTAEAARRTGLPAGVPVITGTIDAWAEAASVGVGGPGEVMVMYGTTMFLIEVLERRRTWPTLWGTVGVHPDTYTLAAGMATAGSITDWLRTLTGERSYTRLLEAARAVPPGAEGLVLLPYFAGERTPLFDPYARGVLAGLTLRHRPGHLYRAALEAIACGVRHNLEAMREAGGVDRRLVAVGGGTQGGLWTQIVSDVTGRAQDLPRHTIGACYGDALLAGQAIGAVSDSASWNPIVSTVRPDPANTATYERLYRAYRDLYEATAPIVHRLSDTH